MRRTPPPRHHLTEAEVAGFREGVAHSLSERRRIGSPDPDGEADLAEADRALARHSLREAELSLVRAYDRLALAQPEHEVTERPRGLVSFVAPGPPDVPVSPEEDRLRNRILLVTRLATVRARAGADVAEALVLLGRAREALERSDRSAAKSWVDQATDQLDRSVPPAPSAGAASRPARDG